MSLKLITTGVALAGLVVLAGCAAPGTPSTGSPMPPPPPGTACNAEGAQFAVGKRAAASTVEEARQRSGSYMARVLWPKQVVTMEFNAQRLNLDVDAAGVVQRVRCG
ncbi:I78 family peptidase inhibitor [Polaromonas sp.]|uniref:I78 family peptidase inhibitor n=1 Tax=Polaromonas sp. TaxID=1869339 RepID=UPI003CBBE72F